MKRLIFCTLALLAFFSCQKVLDLDAETKTPKLVVNSLFNSDSTWKVHVSKSLSVIDNGELKDINTATVRIFDDNNNLLEQLSSSGKGIYHSPTNLKPTLGKEYKVEVSASSFVTVSAKDFCPPSVPILGIDTSSTISSFGDKEQNVTIRFQDPAGGKNYYGIELELMRYKRNFNSSTSTYDTTFIGSDNIYLSSSNPVVDNGPDSYAQTLTLKDNLFNGQQQSISFSYYSYDSGDPDEFSVKKISLLSLTDGTYKYLKSIEAYRNVDGNPFAEPVQVFTNVDNGFGIFGGQSRFEITH